MNKLTRWLIPILFHTAVSMKTFYLADSSTVVFPQDSLNPTYTNLTGALLCDSEQSIELIFSLGLFDIATFGNHRNLTFHCQNTQLVVISPLIIDIGVAVLFDSCKFSSSIVQRDLVLMMVLGDLTVRNSTIDSVYQKAFLVYGSLSLIDSVFTKNHNSVLAAAMFGFRLSVQNCLFENNTSPVGTGLQLGLSSSPTTSATSITIDSCVFRRNIGQMGASVLYLNVNPNIEFSESQQTEQRWLIVRNSLFEGNPGSANIVISKYMNVTFHNNTYLQHDYGFVLQLYNAQFSLSNSTFVSVNNVVISTRLTGVLNVTGVKVDTIRIGPAILVRNSASFDDSLAIVTDLDIVHPVFSPKIMFSAGIFALNTIVRLDGVSVRDGTSYGGINAAFSYCFVTMRRIFLERVTFNGSLFVLFHAQAVASDLSVRNVTMNNGVLLSAYYSSVSVTGALFDPGIATFLITPKVRSNVVVAFDSNVTWRNGSVNFPPIANFPAIYLWKSSADIANIQFSALYSNLVNLFEHSSVRLANVTLDDFSANSMAFMGFYCNASISGISVARLRLKSSIVSGLAYSHISIDRVHFLDASLESIVMASHSQIRVADIALSHLRADTLFWYIVESRIEVSNLQITDSTFDLMQLSSGQILFDNVHISGITVRRKFITLTGGYVEFNDFTLIHLEAFSITPLCVAKKGSQILLRNVRWDGFESREQGLIQLIDSRMTIDHSEISGFNVTFVYASNSIVSISNSRIANGGLKFMDLTSKAKGSAGFLDCLDCVIHLSRSFFFNISGTDGGVLAVASTKNQSQLSIEGCSFDHCFAENNGACVAAFAATVTISESNFTNGAAIRGGALFFDCESGKVCECSLMQSGFEGNTAVEGGVVKWTKVRPTYRQVTNRNNTAMYGNLEASLPSHTALLNSNNSIMRGVPGVVVVEPILIGFMDVVGQLVATDNSSSAELISDHVVGTNYLIAVNGVANFSGIIVRTTPGTSVPITVVSESINKTFPLSDNVVSHFVYETRKCVMGEVSTEQGCYLCPKNTFSVDPNEHECRECPEYATCPGGLALILDPGYWRPSESHSDVYLCFLRKPCLGGQNSTCADGYRSRLCSLCDTDYYSAGLTYCIHCEPVYVRVVRCVIFAALSVCLWIYITRRSVAMRNGNFQVATVTTLKIVIGFFQSLISISLINVDLQPVLMAILSVIEMFASFSLSSLTIECERSEHYAGFSVPPVVIITAIAGGFPFVLFSILKLLAFLSKSRNVQNHSASFVLILFYCFQPYVLKLAFTLIACKSVETADYYLLADASVRCWEPHHLIYVCCLFLPIVVLYGIGFPAFLCYKVYKNTDRISLNYFKCGLKAKFFYWELVVLLRKSTVILILGVAGCTDSVIQILSSLVALYLFMEWTIHAEPYISAFHNRLESLSVFLQFFLTGSSFYFIAKIAIPEVVLTALGLALSVILLAFLITVLIFLVGQGCLWDKNRTFKTTAAPNESSISFPSLEGPPPSGIASEVEESVGK